MIQQIVGKNNYKLSIYLNQIFCIFKNSIHTYKQYEHIYLFSCLLHNNNILYTNKSTNLIQYC